MLEAVSPVNRDDTITAHPPVKSLAPLKAESVDISTKNWVLAGLPPVDQLTVKLELSTPEKALVERAVGIEAKVTVELKDPQSLVLLSTFLDCP